MRPYKNGNAFGNDFIHWVESSSHSIIVHWKFLTLHDKSSILLKCLDDKWYANRSIVMAINLTILDTANSYFRKSRKYSEKGSMPGAQN